MGLSLHELIFTPADIATDSDGGANVGAYVRAGTDGELIDSTSGSLHVNVTAFSAADVDIRDLVFATDKVDVSGSVVALDAPTLAALESITVSAVDLDIRNLVFADDKVDVSGSTVAATQSGTWNVNLTDDGVADDAADSGNPFKVGGIARATSAALDLADAADRVDMTMTLARHVLTADMATQAIKQQVVSVADTAGLLIATPLANRKKVEIQNDSDKAIFIGTTTVTADATATGGFKIPKGDSYVVEASGGVAIYAIATASAAGIRVLEYA